MLPSEISARSRDIQIFSTSCPVTCMFYTGYSIEHGSSVFTWFIRSSVLAWFIRFSVQADESMLNLRLSYQYQNAQRFGQCSEVETGIWKYAGLNKKSTVLIWVLLLFHMVIGEMCFWTLPYRRILKTIAQQVNIATKAENHVTYFDYFVSVFEQNG